MAMAKHLRECNKMMIIPQAPSKFLDKIYNIFQNAINDTKLHIFEGT